MNSFEKILTLLSLLFAFATTEVVADYYWVSTPRGGYWQYRNPVTSSAGFIAGIVIGSLVLVGVIVAVCILVYRNNINNRQKAAVLGTQQAFVATQPVMYAQPGQGQPMAPPYGYYPYATQSVYPPQQPGVNSQNPPQAQGSQSVTIA